jgi:hypothetical protein
MRWTALLLSGVVVALPATSLAQTIDDRARAAAAAARSRTSDSDTLLGTTITPGMSGQAITTVDGSTSFTTALACQKTAKLLEVLIQPAASGDIDVVRISRDTDLDGTFDSSATLPVPVSGICANGVTSCAAGTWNQCRSFRWDVDTAKALKLTEVDMPTLAGCYCVNNSCGTNLVYGNLATVLKDLGGGMVGALTSADPRLGVAQAQISGPVIDYVGAQTTACTASTTVAQTSYRSNTSAIQGDAAALVATDTVFQTLAASTTASGKSQQLHACTITREVKLSHATVDDVISRTSGGYATVYGTSGVVDFQMGSPADNTLSGGGCGFFNFKMTLHVEDPDRLTSVTMPTAFADDWGQVWIDDTLIGYGPGNWTSLGYPPGACETNQTHYFAPNIDLKPWFTKGDHQVWLRVAVGDKGEGYALIHAVVDTTCHTSEQVVDLCAGYAADSNCHLYTEQVDGVGTFYNGAATGLRPLQQTRLFGDATCPLQLTRDFFERDRVYACTTDSVAITEPDLTRGAYIIDHSTETLLADRQTASDGTVTTSTSAFALPQQAAVSSCEAICKTRAPSANTAATPDGTVASLQNTATGYDTFYHTCSDTNVCPVGAGEEIVSNCGCLDDFPEAVVMMQTVRLAGADMVCTSAAR